MELLSVHRSTMHSLPMQKLLQQGEEGHEVRVFSYNCPERYPASQVNPVGAGNQNRLVQVRPAK